MVDEFWLGPMLAEEQELLGRERSLVVAADDASLAAIGPNPLDPSRRPAAFEAGRAQGAARLDAVGSFWAT